MKRASFEEISCIREMLDLNLVASKITPSQYAEAVHDVLQGLGWSEDEFDAEVDRRWIYDDLS